MLFPIDRTDEEQTTRDKWTVSDPREDPGLCADSFEPLRSFAELSNILHFRRGHFPSSLSDCLVDVSVIILLALLIIRVV